VRNDMLREFLRSRPCCFCELLRFPEIHCTFMLSHRRELPKRTGLFLMLRAREWMLP
jgi:hypothetical protein